MRTMWRRPRRTSAAARSGTSPLCRSRALGRAARPRSSSAALEQAPHWCSSRTANARTSPSCAHPSGGYESQAAGADCKRRLTRMLRVRTSRVRVLLRVCTRTGHRDGARRRAREQATGAVPRACADGRRGGRCRTGSPGPGPVGARMDARALQRRQRRCTVRHQAATDRHRDARRPSLTLAGWRWAVAGLWCWPTCLRRSCARRVCQRTWALRWCGPLRPATPPLHRRRTGCRPHNPCRLPRSSAAWPRPSSPTYACDAAAVTRMPCSLCSHYVRGAGGARLRCNSASTERSPPLPTSSRPDPTAPPPGCRPPQ